MKFSTSPLVSSTLCMSLLLYWWYSMDLLIYYSILLPFFPPATYLDLGIEFDFLEETLVILFFTNVLSFVLIVLIAHKFHMSSYSLLLFAHL